MPYVENVNTDIFDPDGKRNLQEWALLNKSNYTMLLVWDEFDRLQKTDIRAWLSEAGFDVEEAKLPFFPLKEVWGVLWRMQVQNQMVSDIMRTIARCVKRQLQVDREQKTEHR